MSMTNMQVYAVKQRLLAGYGVEDIAVTMGLSVGELRAKVSHWRKVGTLRVLFGHSSEAGREFAYQRAVAIMRGSI